MKTKLMKLEDIKPAAYNPRVTLKSEDPEYEALSGSIDRFGLVVPLIVNERTGTLVSGHQRLNALKKAGVEEQVVVIIDVDEEKEKILNVSLNKISGDWDYEKLKALFSDFDPEDIKFTGFSEEELDNLFDSNAEEELDDIFDETEEQQADSQKEPDDGDDEPEAKEFSVYLSFPTKEAAEKWLKSKGVSEEYKGTNRNITIRMEGLGYGN